MKKFKDFKINSTLKNFVGQKINILSILNKEITILDYRIEDSRYGAGKKCLYLQVQVDADKKVIFIGSKSLIDMIEQVPKNEFPFKAIVNKDNDRYEFS